MGKHKHKKVKKKSKRSKHETSSSNDSSDESNQWVEKAADNNSRITSNDGNSFDEFSFLPTTAQSDIKRRRLEEKEKKTVSDVYDPGTNSRELNPYWKNGGSGVPTAGTDETAERYGSLEELKSKIAAKANLREQQTKSDNAGNSESGTKYTSRDASYIKGNSKRDEPRWKDSGVRWTDSESSKRSTMFQRPDTESRSKFQRPDNESGSKFQPSDTELRSEFQRSDVESRSTTTRFQRPDSESRSAARFQNPDTESRSEFHYSKSESRTMSAKFQRPDTEPKINSEGFQREDKSRNVARNSIKEDFKTTEIMKNQQREAKQAVQTKEAEKVEVCRIAREPASFRCLTAKEKNELGAKIMRAELLGNDELARELKSKLDSGQTEILPEDDEVEKVILLSRINKSGIERPVFGKASGESMADLIREERMTSSTEQNFMFLDVAAKNFVKNQTDEDASDVTKLMDVAEKSAQKYIDREQQQAIIDSKKMAKRIGNCEHCLDNVAKHLIVSFGSKVYLSLPSGVSLTEGHCLIVPMQHTTQSTVADEDVWAEIQKFRLALTRLFADRDEDCVFLETSLNLKRQPHMYIECIPLSREIGDLAPIYFKKAIQESESEWADNKKCIDISKKSIRNAVPKGFPYFAVDFGMQGGFAHVIEDERTFPAYFGKEIVGGILDLNPSIWRKPKPESFEEQCKKVLKFANSWKAYDCTS